MNRFAKRRLFHAKAGAKGGKRDGVYYRSRWEYNVSLCLDAMKARGEIHEWAYESREFEFVGVKRGTRFYKPDFEVTYDTGAEPVYWEVKGHLDDKSVTALTRMAKYHPKVKILLVGEQEYKRLESDFSYLDAWERNV